MQRARAMTTQGPVLTGFVATQPRYAITQEASFEWLARAHAESEAVGAGLDADARDRFADRIRNALAKVGCGADKIRRRGVSVTEMATGTVDGELYDLLASQRGATTAARTRAFARLATGYIAGCYAEEREPPDDLIHITCTGYVSPSPAQRYVADRGWGDATRVTHAYQMGCYAAVPALRIAAGYVATGAQRVDLVHTELCSLHFDPSDHSLEQLVVQSLFADGTIRYSLLPAAPRGLRVLAVEEHILADSAGAMSWSVGDAGMQMTLARDVPERIAGALRPFVTWLLASAGRGVGELRDAILAVHPGGPRILDRVEQVLELAPAQLAGSRAVLHDHGNMSSATLPHIWQRIVDDRSIAPGTLVPSLAFGPGLTMCGALLEVC